MANKNRGVIKRIDVELARQMKKVADQNDISEVQASREIARLNNIKFVNKKIIKEIRF